MSGTDNASTTPTVLQGMDEASGNGKGLLPGSRIAAYVIKHMLGEGGMGQVYLADQLQPVQREVALKVLREQVSGTLARAYFEIERQALAQMQHAAIAQVFDAGSTEDGRAYIVMEHVKASL